MIPAHWNGTLLATGPGYIFPGTPLAQITLPWALAGDLVGPWLLKEGDALAAAYSGTGWAVQEDMDDEIGTLKTLWCLMSAETCLTSSPQTPRRTIAWGGSLGGLVAAGLIQNHPELFSAGLALSGPLAGSVGTFNMLLDFAFAIKQLLGPSSGLTLTNITDPSANLTIATGLLKTAQGTAAGRARIALASALIDLPGWFAPATDPTRPAPTDYATQEANQFRFATAFAVPLAFALRAELEGRAGGNPSWNTEVNYRQQLEKSVNYDEVQALYAAAGLSLDDDLATLNAALRIAADGGAVEYLTENVVFDGNLSGLPVLTVNCIGDGAVVNQHAQAYRSVVRDAKDSQLLRQAFKYRGGAGGIGHCAGTAAESIAAVQALVQRPDTADWRGFADPDSLNASAAALGPAYNKIGGVEIAPVYVSFDPAPFLRPYDLGSR